MANTAENSAISRENVFSPKQAGGTLDIIYDLSSLGHHIGHVAEIESSSTAWAAWAAASLPDAMAMLQSASLHGQNVVDTVAGHGYRVSGVLQCLHQQTLLPGCHSAKYRIAKCRLLQLFFCPQASGIHIFVRVVNARQLGDLGKPSGDYLRK